jgi:hypothetical protein
MGILRAGLIAIALLLAWWALRSVDAHAQAAAIATATPASVAP